MYLNKEVAYTADQPCDQQSQEQPPETSHAEKTVCIKNKGKYIRQSITTQSDQEFSAFVNLDFIIEKSMCCCIFIRCFNNK